MMSSSFSYHKLKKLPPPDAQAHQGQDRYAISVQGCYHHAGAIFARRRITWRSFAGGGGRRRRPRLRISSLARVLRRKAAAWGDRVRASVAKVVARLKEGRPYVGDLFAGNYMFMQVTPSSTMAGLDRSFLPYYYGKTKGKPGSLTCLHPVPGVLYNV